MKAFDLAREYKKSADIRAQLLDSAEALFAERGYYGTSVRDITDKAGLRSASINYHFKTKENLFASVIDRRIEPLAEMRRERLTQAALDPDGADNSVRQIVQAFSEPMLELSDQGGPGWRNYCILIAHLAVQKQWSENSVSQKYDAHARLFLNALRRVFPEADDYQVHCCFQFMLSNTLYAVCNNERLDTLSEGAYNSDDFTRLRGPFYDYVTGGIMSVMTKNGA